MSDEPKDLKETLSPGRDAGFGSASDKKLSPTKSTEGDTPPPTKE